MFGIIQNCIFTILQHNLSWNTAINQRNFICDGTLVNSDRASNPWQLVYLIFTVVEIVCVLNLSDGGGGTV